MITMLPPEAGDIWQWKSSDTTYWTVLVIEQSSKYESDFLCMCLEDGEIAEWGFRPTDLSRWKKLA